MRGSTRSPSWHVQRLALARTWSRAGMGAPFGTAIVGASGMAGQAGRRGPPGPSPKRGRGRAQREPDPSVLRKLGTDRHHLPGVAPEAALPPGSLSRNPVLTSDARRSLRRLEPHGQSTCQPTSRAPPGTREALIGRRGSPVASLALGRVIGQWTIAPGTKVEVHLGIPRSPSSTARTLTDHSARTTAGTSR
jgi:hypothetical protein